MAKKAQIKRSWLVFPPNYDHRKDTFYRIPFLKDAWNKACSLGEGAEVWLSVERTDRSGNEFWSRPGDTIYIVERRKRR